MAEEPSSSQRRKQGTPGQKSSTTNTHLIRSQKRHKYFNKTLPHCLTHLASCCQCHGSQCLQNTFPEINRRLWINIIASLFFTFVQTRLEQSEIYFKMSCKLKIQRQTNFSIIVHPFYVSMRGHVYFTPVLFFPKKSVCSFYRFISKAVLGQKKEDFC